MGLTQISTDGVKNDAITKIEALETRVATLEAG